MFCELCDNPYPYMCSECQDEDVGPAASRQHIPYASMGREFVGSINIAEAAPAKQFIGSGEDVELEPN